MTPAQKVMEVHHHRLFKPFFSLFILLLTINIIYLDYRIFLIPPKITTIIKSAEKDKLSSDSICPTSCISEINEAVSKVQEDDLSQADETVIDSQVKDYYVTFGSGQSTSTTWSNVTGLTATINPSNYPNIKQINFEVSMYIPTGNETAGVQLLDVTDGYVVWNSEMQISGGEPQYLISNPITLAPGNKQYQVQMITQLGAPAILNQARLHIVLN